MNQVKFENVTVTVYGLVSLLEFKNIFWVFNFVPKFTLGTRNEVRHVLLTYSHYLSKITSVLTLQNTIFADSLRSDEPVLRVGCYLRSSRREGGHGWFVWFEQGEAPQGDSW